MTPRLDREFETLSHWGMILEMEIEVPDWVGTVRDPTQEGHHSTRNLIATDKPSCSILIIATFPSGRPADVAAAQRPACRLAQGRFDQ
jgi:hypothetical protein